MQTGSILPRSYNLTHINIHMEATDKDFLVKIKSNVVVLMLISWAPNVQGRDREKQIYVQQGPKLTTSFS